jgi:hypothetical protein
MSGQESGLYKAFTRFDRPDLLAQLSTQQWWQQMMQHVADYINVCYKALILQNDAYVTDSFAEFNALSESGTHNEICLLNQILQIILTFQSVIDRTKFNTATYDTYMASFEAEFNKALPGIVPGVVSLLAHRCSKNEDIRKCDPNKPLIEIRVKEADGGDQKEDGEEETAAQAGELKED